MTYSYGVANCVCIVVSSCGCTVLCIFFFSSRRRHTRYWRDWSSDVCSSDLYLIQLTSQVLAKRDRATGRPLVDVILDEAAQKGTGKWASQSALDLGIPVTAITEAVFARMLSALKADRMVASRVLPGPTRPFGTDEQ